MSSRCPPEELLGQFLSDQLTQAHEDDLESHLRDCGDCRQRLDHLAADSDITSVLAIPAYPPLSPEFSQRLEDSLRGCTHNNDDGEWLPALDEIPGYQLIEIIGRGGSSIVYRARDLKLKRAVAIKMLRSRAGRIDRERFQREATALASLRHPNITRAHGAGETNERPYLVMEYVAGGNLGRQIAGQPQPPLAAARLVRQLADAIDSAHAAGFVHRDLKPTNVLLEPHFGQGETSGLDRYVPKITDLGIVKDLSRDDNLTRTRDCLGTPSYMAPEQVKGSTQAVDGRTDVYALGAVLYELLTGRPPFRAASPLDTMLQVKHDEPVPPSRFCPRLPVDLETIALKCLEKDPDRRYQSARLLAADLNRLLKGQPILARRTRWPGKVWRWSRRNPGWAAALVISILILLALTIGGPLLARRERELREQTLEHERVAQRERAWARDQFELASQALESTLDQVLRSARLQDAALDDVRAGLIRSAIPYYEQFLQNDDSDRAVRVRQARMLLQLASVHTREQHPDQAREAYRRSLELLDSLGGDSASLDRTTKNCLATALMEYGRFVQITDRDDAGAEPHYRRAVALRLDLVEAHPADVGMRDNAAIALSLFGTLLQSAPGRTTESLNCLNRACAIRDQLVAEFPQRDDLRHYAALTHLNLGLFHRQYNHGEDEIREFHLAWELEKDLTPSPTVSPDSPYFQALIEGELGVALARAGRRKDALVHLKPAIRTMEMLETMYPAVKRFSEPRVDFQEALTLVENQNTPDR